MPRDVVIPIRIPLSVEILRRIGVRISVDDFGTGYSSLIQLRRLNARTLKIDQHFVRDMLVDPDDHTIVESVIRLSESFRRDVVAEVREGVTELTCHPGYVEPGFPSSYAAEREVELRTLCDHRVRQAIGDMAICLISFRDLPALATHISVPEGARWPRS